MSDIKIKPSIEVSQLSFAYSNGVQALDQASFHIESGSITGLVGVNGSGKSTLFKSIMGFLKPQHGYVRLSGLKPSEAMRAQLVAYVPQSEEIDWDFPVLVRDVVMMGRYGHMNWLRWPRAIDQQKVEAALERVDMLHYAERQIGELSGGQRKRVFLARALAQEANIMLLDEPFTGIDVTSEMAIIDLLTDLRSEGRIILISTHNLGSVPDFCDQTILINKSILAYGATSDVFTQDNLQRTFGGLLRRFILTGDQLHDDEDPRQLVVLTDDERPFVIYGDDKAQTEHKPKQNNSNKPNPL